MKRFRRILTLSLALCLVFGLLPAVVVPSDAVTPNYTPSSSYQSSNYYSKLLNVKLTGNQRDDIIAVALSQVGYMESATSGDFNGSNDGSYNNYVEYNYWYNTQISSDMPQGGSYAHWCATFVSWCAEMAGIPKSILNRSTAAGHSASYFNIYFYSGSSTLNSSSDNNYHFLGYNYTPKKGDLFYTRTWSHVGLVVEVNGAYVTTVEGNTNDGGSADGIGVYKRTRAISSLYFGAPAYTESVHTCDKGTKVSVDSAHPHYSNYECSVCGEVWTDNTETNVSNSCITCQQPGKPSFVGMKNAYSDNESVMFQWNAAANTTHYELQIEKKDYTQAWEVYEQVSYATSGLERRLPDGEYRCKVRAGNSGYQGGDIYADSDYFYFSVAKSYFTVEFDAAGGFCSLLSQTALNGKVIGELPTPTWSGYNFLGWFTAGGEQVLPTTVIYSDMVVYARWEKAIIVPTLTLSHPSLSFEDEILYNVYFNVDNPQYIEEMGMATYAYPNSSGTVDNAMAVIPGYVSDGTTYMVQSNGIPAKNLGDVLYFKVYARLTDGSYVYSSVAGYNAVAYAKSVLAGNNAKAKSLVVAMLNYGAAAQVQFNHKPYSPMNDFLTADQQALVKDYNQNMVGSVVQASSSKVGAFVMNGGYSGIYPTVSFEGAFSINYYFTPNKTVDGTVTFYYWDSATYNSVSRLTTNNATGVVTMQQDGGEWYAAVEGIAAKSVDETVYVAAMYTSGGVSYPTGIIAYSLGKYCQTIAANGNAFGAATAVYGYYAKAYFA